MAVELRRFMRLETEYRVEYGPFPLTGRGDEFKTSVIKNIGGGGLMFLAPEPLSGGRQLVMKIYITGWRPDGDDLIEAPGEDVETPITAVAEVTHCEFNQAEGRWSVGVKFLGRIL
ncbi:MAG: hypothetical protein AB1896_14155 [Thermodesulfobacteriota bacterium]